MTNLYPNGVTLTDPKILYREMLAGPKGCHYILFREPEHTDADIDKAKRWIKYHLDCLKIKVVLYETLQIQQGDPSIREDIQEIVLQSEPDNRCFPCDSIPNRLVIRY